MGGSNVLYTPALCLDIFNWWVRLKPAQSCWKYHVILSCVIATLVLVALLVKIFNWWVRLNLKLLGISCYVILCYR